MKGDLKMKKLFAALAALAAVAFVLPTAARAANIGVDFMETSVNGGPETLSVNYPGAVISGTTDDWNILLPGITLSSVDLPQVWVEKPGDAGFNDLSIVNSDTLHLASEAPLIGTPDNFCGTGAPLPEGATCFIGNGDGNAYFGTVTESSVVAAAPEPASLALLGSGLLGFAMMRRRRNRV